MILRVPKPAKECKAGDSNCLGLDKLGVSYLAACHEDLQCQSCICERKNAHRVGIKATKNILRKVGYE